MPFSKAEAEIILRASNKILERDLRKSKSLVSRTFGRIGSKIKRGLKSALSPLGVGAGVAGLAVLGKQVVDFEDKLNRLEIQSGASRERIAKFRGELIAMSKDTGIGRNELLAATDALVNLTGKAGFSVEKMRLLARANLATGAATQDLAGLMFALEKSLDVKPENMEKALAGIIEAGKTGSVPLNEMVVAMQKLAGSFAQLGKGTGAAGAADLATAFQILRTRFGNIDQAATGLQGFLTALTRNAKQLRRAGVQVFVKDPKTGEKSYAKLRDILSQIAASPVYRDPEKRGQLFPEVRGRKAVEALISLRGAFEDQSRAARKAESLQADIDKRRSSSAFKFKKAMNEAKEAFLQAFTPARIRMFADAMAKVAKLLSFAVDHAKELLLAFGAIKLGGVVAQVMAMKAGMSATAASALQLKGAVAGIAAYAGFKLGQYLDKKLGISDKIAGLRDDELQRGDQRAKLAFVRSRAGDIDLERSKGLAARAGFAGGGVNTSKVFRAARTSLISARGQGLIDKGGNINLEAAQKLIDKGQDTKGELQELGGSLTELVAKLTEAQRLVALQMQGGVELTVDESGNFRAHFRTTENARRSPQ